MAELIKSWKLKENVRVDIEEMMNSLESSIAPKGGIATFTVSQYQDVVHVKMQAIGEIPPSMESIFPAMCYRYLDGLGLLPKGTQ